MLKVLENDQNPLLVHTSPSTMENNQSQLAPDKGTSSLESVRPEHEDSSSVFEGLPDLDTKRPYRRTSFCEDLNTFEPDEPFQIQSDTAHQVNRIVPQRREEKETKKSKEWKQLDEQSQKWMLDEEVLKQVSKHVINLPGAGFDPNGENNGGE